MAGAINVDYNPKVNPDVVADFEKPLPFKDNSVEEIQCIHTLEHIEDAVGLIEEMWRVCKPNAKIIVEVPYYKSSLAYCDLTHKHYFCESSFGHFTEGHPQNYYSRARFKVKVTKLKCKHKIRPSFLSPVESLRFELEVIKPVQKIGVCQAAIMSG
jgi:ubiquinone/menaquinone biosynthesis C-methylase UbiE